MSLMDDGAVPMNEQPLSPNPPTPGFVPESRRYNFNCLTGQSILSASDGLRCAIPGTEIHCGACDGVAGSWQETLLPVTEIHTISWRWVFPLETPKHEGKNVVSPKSKLINRNHSTESPSMVDPQWNIWYWGSKWNLHTVCCNSVVGCEWGTTSVYFGITYVCFIPVDFLSLLLSPSTYIKIF